MPNFLAANWANCWVHCPGFARLNTEISVPFEATERQIEGTAIHASVARFCTEGKEDAYTAEFGKPFYALVAADQCGFETPLSADWLVSGYRIRIDGWNFKSGVLTVFELKTGWTPVSAVINPTLLIYALTLADHLQPKSIKLAVFQPRVNKETPETFTLGPDPDAYKEWVRKRYAMAKQGAELNPGPHCGFCPNRAACPALRGSTGVALDFAYGYSAKAPSPGEIGSEIEILRNAAKRIKDRLSGLEQLATHRIERGVPIPGFELTRGWSNRKWRDPDAARYILTALGISPENGRIISPAQAERRGVSKEIIAELSERKATTPTLTQIK